MAGRVARWLTLDVVPKYSKLYWLVLCFVAGCSTAVIRNDAAKQTASDLRRSFVSTREVPAAVRDRSCIVIFELVRDTPKLIALGDNTRVVDVLGAALKREWHNGSLTLVSKDSKATSPPEDRKLFLQRRPQPGDIVVIGARE
jgi:hypothetical protein